MYVVSNIIYKLTYILNLQFRFAVCLTKLVSSDSKWSQQRPQSTQYVYELHKKLKRLITIRARFQLMHNNNTEQFNI